MGPQEPAPPLPPGMPLESCRWGCVRQTPRKGPSHPRLISTPGAFLQEAPAGLRLRGPGGVRGGGAGHQPQGLALEQELVQCCVLNTRGLPEGPLNARAAFSTWEQDAGAGVGSAAGIPGPADEAAPPTGARRTEKCPLRQRCRGESLLGVLPAPPAPGRAPAGRSSLPSSERPSPSPPPHPAAGWERGGHDAAGVWPCWAPSSLATSWASSAGPAVGHE